MRKFPHKPEPYLATLARLFAANGEEREVDILSSAVAEFTCIEGDNWNGGTYYWQVELRIPLTLFSSISEEEEHHICTRISQMSEQLLKAYRYDVLHDVVITPVTETDAVWREKAQAWLARHDVNNQGRVRSDNVASLSSDGLRFRSKQEIYLYKALKAIGVSFAPLAVFVRGGKEYRRIEPDFVLYRDGLLLIVEIDGDLTHQETPVDAHNRTTMLVHEGAHVERIRASECDTLELAHQCVAKLLRVLEKLKNSR